MDVGHRVKHFRERAKLSQIKLAEKAGVDRSHISKLEGGESLPSLDLLARICEHTGITPAEFFGSDVRPIPIVAGTVKAGIPIRVESYFEGVLNVERSCRADFAVQVSGDSMVWAGVHEGDYALCRSSETATNGQMVVAAVQDVEWGGTIKYFVQANGRKILRAANPEYKDITLSPEDRIVGVVAAVLKDNPPALHTYENLVAASTGRGPGVGFAGGDCSCSRMESAGHRRSTKVDGKVEAGEGIAWIR